MFVSRPGWAPWIRHEWLFAPPTLPVAVSRFYRRSLNRKSRRFSQQSEGLRGRGWWLLYNLYSRPESLLSRLTDSWTRRDPRVDHQASYWRHWWTFDDRWIGMKRLLCLKRNDKRTLRKVVLKSHLLLNLASLRKKIRREKLITLIHRYRHCRVSLSIPDLFCYH